jgi:hypothetical protein
MMNSSVFLNKPSSLLKCQTIAYGWILSDKKVKTGREKNGFLPWEDESRQQFEERSKLFGLK